MHVVITHKPGYMYDIVLYEDGKRMYGMVRCTLWGARFAAQRALKRAERDRLSGEYREEVRL
ncbi:hypothetical protein GCM10007170_15680 [Arthrobacter liuii]|uniref:AP2 domain-containing protein n=1 Tax=Arthrobacter liuii TaxID=1476996 RepID=A0ABQ2AMI2_9MICC|nr:hypothetical protein GCM10007170_15680 [Arthrobacter liuii]